MRTFIAVDLPEHIKSNIFHEFETLQKKNFFKGTFVEKENIHITLKFLGEISKEDIEKIIKQLKETKMPKFKCSFGKVRVFDNENHIKIIFVEVISDKLKELNKIISDKFHEIPSDFSSFSPHLTTARVKSVTNKEGLIKYLDKMNFKNLEFEVSEFLLMKSELMREGTNYKILEKFKLS